MSGKENKEFFEALRMGKVLTTRKMLQGNSPLINCKDRFNWIPLKIACQSSQPGKMVKMLVEEGEKIDDCDIEHQMEVALQFASTMGLSEATRALLEGGADVNAASPLGHTPLIGGCSQGKVDVVRILLDWKETEVNTKPSLATALGATIRARELACLRALLEHKDIDVNLCDFSGSPLSSAVARGWQKGVKLLLNHRGLKGVDKPTDLLSTSNNMVTFPDFTQIKRAPLLILAAQLGVKTAKTLTTHPKVNVNVQCESGKQKTWTALMLACRFGNASMVEELLARKDIDLNIVNQISGGKKVSNHGTALHCAIQCDEGDAKNTILEALLSREDLDVNAHTKNSCTPLMLAVERMEMETVARLLKRKDIDVNLKTDFGTARTVAECLGHKKLMQMLDTHTPPGESKVFTPPESVAPPEYESDGECEEPSTPVQEASKERYGEENNVKTNISVPSGDEECLPPSYDSLF